MRSITFTHGALGSLWLETDAGRVIVRTVGMLSPVARAGLLEQAMVDLANRTRIPADILQILIVNASTSWPRKIFAWIVKSLYAQKLSRL